MSRLIDADALIETLKTEPKYSVEAPRSFKAIRNLIAFHHSKVVEVINNQPTAYDVDKVVEQLEGKKYNVCYTDNARGYDFAIDTAIEIVKQGRQ